MEDMFFSSWSAVIRTVIVGSLAYIGLIMFLRASGKRTLSKMNAYDLVVTVALGSTLATITLSADVALAQGLVAVALLIVLQFAITWSSVRWHWIRRVVTGEPTLLLYQGEYLHESMRRARVTEAEVRAAVRGGGYGSPEDIKAVVLETDGSSSVVSTRTNRAATLADVKR